MNFIHIGTEKTGTTQLQNFFAANRLVLKQDFNIDFRCSETGHGHSSDLVNSVSDVFFQDLPKREFKSKCIWQCEHTLLSSEHFSSRLVNSTEISNLKDILGVKGPYTIIVYVKPQEELLVGMYAEAIKSGRDLSDLPPPDQILKNKYYGISYFDYMEMLTPWWKVFGSENSFIINSYNRKDLVGKDICKDFSEKVLKNYGDVRKLILPKGNSNRTFSPEMLLSLRRFEDKFSMIPKYKLHSLLIEYDEFDNGVFLTQEELNMFRDQFAESNSRLSDYLSVDKLFPEVKAIRTLDKGYVMDELVFEAIAGQVSERIKRDNL